MNQRIEQLAGQALDREVPYTWTTLDRFELDRLQARFAELIVKECFTKLTPYLDDQFIDDVESELKEHFGIKE